MCYARKFLTWKAKAKERHFIASTREEDEPKSKAHAQVYEKTKEIMGKFFPARKKDKHAPAL